MKQELIIDNATNGSLDIPTLGIMLHRGAYDVDLIVETGKPYDVVIVDKGFLRAVKLGWLRVKEKKDGRGIDYEQFTKIHFGDALGKIDDYLKGKIKQVPRELLRLVNTKPKAIEVDMRGRKVGKVERIKIYDVDELTAMKYQELVKVATQIGITMDKLKDRKKSTFINEVLNYQKGSEAETVDESVDNVDEE